MRPEARETEKAASTNTALDNILLLGVVILTADFCQILKGKRLDIDFFHVL